MQWYPTDWQFVTSGGFEITAGDVIVFGGGGGVLYARNRVTRNLLELTYGALIDGMGVGEIPVSADLSVTQMPSVGLGKILARNRHTLSPDDFEGFFAMKSMQVGGILGFSVALVLFGLPAPLAVLSDLWPYFAKAAGFLLSSNVGVQFGGGFLNYQGYMNCLG